MTWIPHDTPVVLLIDFNSNNQIIMRKVIDLQMNFWKKDIDNIEFDLQSRDEIPKLLMGLQYIYRATSIREKVFKVLKGITLLY